MPHDHQPVTPEEPTATQVRQAQLLFTRHSAAIRGFIHSLVTHPQDADDVFQEVFITVSEKANAYQPGTNFLAWVYVIAKFKVMQHTQRQQRHQSLSPDTIELLADDAPMQEDKTEARLVSLRDCLKRLKPKVRRLLDMRYKDQLPAAEISKLAGLTVGSVYVTLSQARTFLRNCIDRAQKDAD